MCCILPAGNPHYRSLHPRSWVLVDVELLSQEEATAHVNNKMGCTVRYLHNNKSKFGSINTYACCSHVECSDLHGGGFRCWYTSNTFLVVRSNVRFQFCASPQAKIFVHACLVSAHKFQPHH